MRITVVDVIIYLSAPENIRQAHGKKRQVGNGQNPNGEDGEKWDDRSPDFNQGLLKPQRRQEEIHAHGRCEITQFKIG